MRLHSPDKNDSQLVRDQRGAASLYISFVIMVVLSLLALTFAKIMSDRYIEIAESQLDLQAHYAAESAINTVRSTIHKGLRDRDQVSDAAIDVTVDKAAPSGSNNYGTPSSTHCSSAGAFGASLDVAGDLLAVGAPGAFPGMVCLLTKKSDQWDWLDANIKKTISIGPLTGDEEPDGGSFGAAVALHTNGSILAVGAPEDSSSRGSVYIFVKNSSGTWDFSIKIIPSTPNTREDDLDTNKELKNLSVSGTSSRFGAALEWHEGNLLVGMPGASKVLRLDSSNWESEGNIGPGASGFGSVIVSGSVRFEEKGKSANLAIGADNSKISLFEDGVTAKHFCEYTTGSISDCFFTSDRDSGKSVTAFDISGGVMAVGYGTDNSIDILEREGPAWSKKYRIMIPARTASGWQALNELPADASQAGQALALVQTQDNDRLLIVGDPGENKIHFFKVKSNDILNDIWASGLDQDCPDEEDAHESWRNSQLSEVDGFEDIHYTCVSVEVDPASLIYDHVGTDRSLVLPLYPAIGKNYEDANLKSLTFEWGHVNGSNSFKVRSVDKFSDSDSWQSDTVPVLRVQITAVNLTQSFDRTKLINNTRVFFFYPEESTGGSTDWPSTRDDDGQVINGKCDKSKKALPCSVTVNEISRAGKTDRIVYFVRIQSIYNDAQLRIRGALQASKGEAHFKNIQAVITATGWSAHVAQRIRERIPLRPIYDLPEYGIDSAEDLCKILVTTGHTGVYLDAERDETIRNDSSCSLKTEDQNDNPP